MELTSEAVTAGIHAAWTIEPANGPRGGLEHIALAARAGILAAVAHMEANADV
jgi:hypothetical protein